MRSRVSVAADAGRPGSSLRRGDGLVLGDGRAGLLGARWNPEDALDPAGRLVRSQALDAPCGEGLTTASVEYHLFHRAARVVT
ncbi:hypothetical protein ACIREO_32145 [Streptomyces sp. NPDC102441]|uniref:hypothetical protein n=1 Tax=Streptomyces sp. NPDC102441 TaxID=3366176 RepID=UPI0038266753